MVKSKINELLELKILHEEVNKLMINPHVKKRYSITRNEEPYPVGDNIYQTPFCLFFYEQRYMIKSFLCYLVCIGADFNNAQIRFHDYYCSDVGRADCWEWVDIN